MASDYLYPLDLTGSQPSNTIRDEKHTVSPPSQITQSSFIVLRACPFFAHNIVVKDGKGPTARVLNYGEDYILTHKSIALSMLTKKGVYASVMFKDRNYTGSVYVTYQTVGGEYNLDDYTIVEKLTRQKYIITHTSFDQIVGLPASFPNPPHQHDPIDLVGMGSVVEKIADLAAAIRGNKGSFGLVNATINDHIASSTAHSPAQVGLGNVKNFGLAVTNDYETRTADRYTTADTVADYVNKRINEETVANEARYLTQESAGLLYVKSSDVYSKAESDNLYHSKEYLDQNYLKKSDSVTVAQVGNIVNTIVDMSQYHTRTEALGVFYSRVVADTRFYTRSQTDAKFVSQTDGDARYIQTTDPTAILSQRSDNQLLIENGKFYVGLQAPENVVTLYIDCINGSDNSPGTRAAPLRTLQRAHELTPANKSSTWLLRSYLTFQMDRANIWYSWNFNHKVTDGAKRVISMYGETWIDGAKNSQATQTLDGVCNWWYLDNLSPVEIYLRAFTGGNDAQGIYSAIVEDGSEIVFKGISLLKPKAYDAREWSNRLLKDMSFFHGTGTIRLIGARLLQLGEFKDEDSDRFKWIATDSHDDLKIVFDGCVYGYVRTLITDTGVEYLNVDSSSVFGYTKTEGKPFHFNDATAKITVTNGAGIGLGAASVGGITRNSNMTVALKRTKMIAGLNIVNGVCTNIQSNITLVS